MSTEEHPHDRHPHDGHSQDGHPQDGHPQDGHSKDGRSQAARVIARFLEERAPSASRFLEERAPGASRFLEERAPGASRELALGGLALLETLSQRAGGASRTVEATILFADLVGFSRWVLSAGDEQGLALLREVAAVVEPAIAAHRGRLVKRLGDGHMAAFATPPDALEAALAMQRALEPVSVAGHRPQLRVGLHSGQPQRLGGDYLGTDVNIAARIGAAAGPGEVLASAAVVDAIPPERLERLRVERRRGFRAKGAPAGLEVFSVAG